MKPKTLEDVKAELENVGRTKALLMIALAVKKGFAPGCVPVSLKESLTGWRRSACIPRIDVYTVSDRRRLL